MRTVFALAAPESSLSDEALQPATGSTAPDACAIEIYVFPFTGDDEGNFLTFSSDDNLDAVFLRQWRESLLVYKSKPEKGRAPRLVDFEIDDVMRVKRLVLLTISSGPHGTTVYVDGKVARSNPHFRIHLADLYRRIVLGTSPSNFQVWHGEIHGLAIYDDEISPEQAAAHFADWSGGSTSVRRDCRDHKSHSRSLRFPRAKRQCRSQRNRNRRRP